MSYIEKIIDPHRILIENSQEERDSVRLFGYLKNRTSSFDKLCQEFEEYYQNNSDIEIEKIIDKLEYKIKQTIIIRL